MRTRNFVYAKGMKYGSIFDREILIFSDGG